MGKVEKGAFARAESPSLELTARLFLFGVRVIAKIAYVTPRGACSLIHRRLIVIAQGEYDFINFYGQIKRKTMQFQITTQIGFRVLPTAQTPPLEHLFLIDTDFEPNGKSETLLSHFYLVPSLAKPIIHRDTFLSSEGAPQLKYLLRR